MDKSAHHRRKRPKPTTISTIAATAPWILISQAAHDSGVGEKEIREKLPLRRFGNADYTSPKILNHWISTGELPPRGENLES